jgi:hypothetical protein
MPVVHFVDCSDFFLLLQFPQIFPFGVLAVQRSYAGEDGKGLSFVEHLIYNIIQLSVICTPFL